MALGAFNPVPGGTGFAVTRKRPGHFVALSEDGRIDAVLAQNIKLAVALEKRAAINVNFAQKGPTDGSAPLAPAAGVKSVDPYHITIAMPAEDGEPCVSDVDRDAWSKFRFAYDVTVEAAPFKVTGVLLLLPSQDPMSLAERGSELFLPVFAPSVQVNGVTLRDTPRDALLVNRSHLRRVNATMRC
ncbi:MAG: hypothetical protein ABSE58_03180 [Candidatus Limnocylindrales bacterium]|jgi:hypothetical protein